MDEFAYRRAVFRAQDTSSGCLNMTFSCGYEAKTPIFADLKTLVTESEFFESRLRKNKRTRIIQKSKERNHELTKIIVNSKNYNKQRTKIIVNSRERPQAVFDFLDAIYSETPMLKHCDMLAIGRLSHRFTVKRLHEACDEQLAEVLIAHNLKTDACNDSKNVLLHESDGVTLKMPWELLCFFRMARDIRLKKVQEAIARILKQRFHEVSHELCAAPSELLIPLCQYKNLKLSFREALVEALIHSNRIHVYRGAIQYDHELLQSCKLESLSTPFLHKHQVFFQRDPIRFPKPAKLLRVFLEDFFGTVFCGAFVDELNMYEVVRASYTLECTAAFEICIRGVVLLFHENEKVKRESRIHGIQDTLWYLCLKTCGHLSIKQGAHISDEKEFVISEMLDNLEDSDATKIKWKRVIFELVHF